MVWKDIVGFKDYQISSTGQVKSKQRIIIRNLGGNNHPKVINERILKPALAGNGYGFVCLRKNNRHYNQRIHKLVAAHFLDGYFEGLVVHHKDGNKLNNNVSNLEYVSKQKKHPRIL